MFRFLDVGMLVLGSLLGLASPSMAQPIPGAIPGSGSSVLPPSVTPAPRRSLAPHYPQVQWVSHAVCARPPDPASSAHRRYHPWGIHGSHDESATISTGCSRARRGRNSTSPTTAMARGTLAHRALGGGAYPGPHALLRQFGYDLFTRVPTTFAPVTDVPVGPGYVIGPGDNLNILLWGGVQESYQLEVDRNGAVALPRLGVVQVWGLTLDQVQRLLQQRFSEFYADFRMAVTLGKLRTMLVYVVGEVRQPGAYTVSSLSTIINALFASGGPTKNGSLRRIQLVRQGRQIHTLDLYDLLLRGNKSQDTALQSGDTILVPLIGPVAGVAGNVKRPAIYELDPGMTLQHLLELAGGVTALGYLQRVQVERPVANERKIVVDVDLSAPGPKLLRQTCGRRALLTETWCASSPSCPRWKMPCNWKVTPCVQAATN